MISRRARFAAFMLPVILPFAALAQERVVFTEYKFEDPTLKVMDLDGSNPGDYFAEGNSIPATDWLTVGLALDADAGKIYWLHGSTPGRIRRANLDGSGQEIVISGLKNPRGLALDRQAGKIYWAAAPPEGNAGGLIQRANLNGSGLETVYLDPDYDPVLSKIGRPRLDTVNGWVYFASNTRILRASLDGPPFTYFPVVTGVSTARAVDLDVAEDRIYWIGADTIEDVVCSARLDNSEFSVVYDFSPDNGNSNGLSDLILDLAGQSYLVCDDLGDFIKRGGLDGGEAVTVYGAPAGYSPSAMILDANLEQPFVDCNGNDIADRDDVLDGTSPDCNGNGIPDECEDDPCAPVEYLLDQSLDLTNPGLQLGGAPENQSWILFQPFDVPAGGWEIGEVQVNGVTWTYRPEGFTATFLPDTGGDYPDESQPLAAGDAFFRFAAEWVSLPVAVSLPPGRHWLRLTANDANHYLASVSIVADGLPAMSRSGLGNDFFDRPPLALRIVSAGATAAPVDRAKGGPSLRLLSGTAASGPARLQFSLPRDAAIDLSVFDLQGRRLRRLAAGRHGAGSHAIDWDGRDRAGQTLAAGVYFVRLKAQGSLRSLKLIRLD